MSSLTHPLILPLQQFPDNLHLST